MGELAGEAWSQPGGLQGQRDSPLMGDTPSRVVARRMWPSRVDRLRVVDPRTRQTPPVPSPLAAGVQHFFLDDDEPPVAGSRPDRLSADSVPQERVQRHTVEQMGDVVPVVPVLIAPVPLLGSCEVGCALGRWEPLPPPVCVRPCRELAAGLHRDLTRLEEVRQRTAIEVARWGCELVRRGVSLTSAEIFAMASLQPDNKYWSAC